MSNCTWFLIQLFAQKPKTNDAKKTNNKRSPLLNPPCAPFPFHKDEHGGTKRKRGACTERQGFNVIHGLCETLKAKEEDEDE